MKKFLLFLPVIFILVLSPFMLFKTETKIFYKQWNFQSIDTMKYSRDKSREFMEHSEQSDKVIDKQVSDIAKTGATHVSVATPYDPEFYPILRKWVAAARKNKLKVWFRGNFSGWEQWFGYKQMDRDTHITKTRQFIMANKDIFEDGDMFTSCPECENGPKLEYNNPTELNSYRSFIIEEYRVSKEAFAQINKKVGANYYSMNYDVASAMMDRDTTEALDGVVTIDHYVKDPQELAEDINLLADKSGGKIVLGEFGAPIPDINGNMTDEEQKAWLQQSLELLSQMPQIEGLNYWANMDSSTRLWHDNGNPTLALQVLKDFYSCSVVRGKVLNAQGKAIENAKIIAGPYEVRSDANGEFHLPYLTIGQKISVKRGGYATQGSTISSPYQRLVFVLPTDKNSAGALFSTLQDYFGQ